MKNNHVLAMGELVGGIAQTEFSSLKPGSPFDKDSSTTESTGVRLTDVPSRRESPEIANRVLRVMGAVELTVAYGRRFRKQVLAALNGHTSVEIDLSQTTAIDCAGLGALLAIRNLTRERKGVVRLLKPSSRVQQLLDPMRAGEIFEIVPTSS